MSYKVYLSKVSSRLSTVKSKPSFRVWTLSFRQLVHKQTHSSYTPSSKFLFSARKSLYLIYFSKHIIPKISFPNGPDFSGPGPSGALCFHCCLLCILINLCWQFRIALSSAKCILLTPWVLCWIGEYNTMKPEALSGPESINHLSRITTVMVFILAVLVPMVKYSDKTTSGRMVHFGLQVRCIIAGKSRQQHYESLFTMLAESWTKSNEQIQSTFLDVRVQDPCPSNSPSHGQNMFFHIN